MTPTVSTDLVLRVKLGWLVSCVAAFVAGAIFIITLRFDITTLSEKVALQQIMLNEQSREFYAIKEQLIRIQTDIDYIKKK